MNIGVDIRPLMAEKRTGVGEYTYELLDAIFEIDKQNQYFLFYNSRSDVSKNIPPWKQENVHYIIARWPNKLFNLSIKFFGFPKIDRLIKTPLDYFFSPNINFTTLSKKTKHILTIHDLSFKFYPEFYSSKQRLWHKITNPKKQCLRADLILTPSENTKRDIVDYYKILPEKIKVIYPGLSSIFANAMMDQEKTRQKYNLPNKYILFLCTIEQRNNIIGLI
ncbi:MAG: glycosyltransferase, partial [Patescibacteria group bacterium]